MKKTNILTLIFFLTLNYSYSQESVSTKYSNTITETDLKDLLYVYASDEFEGRETGKKGQKLAVNFLREFYKENKIDAANNTDDYFQKLRINMPGKSITVPYSFPDSVRTFRKKMFGENWLETENVAAIITGSEKPNEYIVLSAHLDHVGKRGTDIYNGADDDGSGSVALLEIAQAFKMAEMEGNGPKRSIVFLHVTAEERGLLGSAFYTENPLYPLEQTITNLNVDMIGRVDPLREAKNTDYIYLIGSDRLSSKLHEVSESINKSTVNLDLDYKFNALDDPNNFYGRSDHYNFAKNNIPVIFYFSGTHEDYHGPGDDPDKIMYDLLTMRTKLIFHTAWEIANMEETINVDVE